MQNENHFLIIISLTRLLPTKIISFIIHTHRQSFYNQQFVYEKEKSPNVFHLQGFLKYGGYFIKVTDDGSFTAIN